MERCPKLSVIMSQTKPDRRPSQPRQRPIKQFEGRESEKKKRKRGRGPSKIRSWGSPNNAEGESSQYDQYYWFRGGNKRGGDKGYGFGQHQTELQNQIGKKEQKPIWD